ncbi:docking protein 1-like [Rhinoderma darwinii]|uniref:docking protein 1-like n=1 Tax=Rhinoderma darwinii TaxID=43563 RepID=UPI003F67FF3A
MFSFEAGRRCQSGPGNFTFETSQGHEIFQKVEVSIRAQQGPEKRLSCPALDTEVPTDNTSLGSDSSGSDVQTKKDVEEKSLIGRALPNLPVAKHVQPQHLLDPSSLGPIPGKTSTPPRSPISRSVSRHSGDDEHLMVYSEPKDSVKGVNPHFDPLYSDPVDSVIAGKDVRLNKEKSAPSPLYSDLYEHVGYEVVGGGISAHHLGLPKLLREGEEHIYDEPEGIAQSSVPPQLYSEVQTEATAWGKANDEKVGYEFPYNPNSDDYSMPIFPGKDTQPRHRTGPKPIPAPKPKPQGKQIPKPPGREDPDKASVPAHATHSNINNNNGNTEAVYSQVLKTGNVDKSTPPLPPKPQSTGPLPLTGTTPALPSQPISHRPQSGPNKSPPAQQDNMRVRTSAGKTVPENEWSELIYEDMGVL